jgi:hypothetical protein
MATTPPIACTLPAAELPLRLAEMSALGHDALISSEREARTARLRFRADGSARRRLDAIVAAESSCCAFLTFDVRTDSDALMLTITAPAGAEPALDDLVAAFTHERHS